MKFHGLYPDLLTYLVLLLSAVQSCQCDVLERRKTSVHSFSNSTSVLPTRSSSTLSTTTVKSSIESPSTTPKAVLFKSKASHFTHSIKPGRLAQWGNQSIPLNTCSTTEDGVTVWNPCSVFAGTVHLSYFPENRGNCTRCATEYYDSNLGMTMTSPSVYLVVNTLYGYNTCGPLGPNYVSQAFPMDLTDVMTIPPYANAKATTRDEIRQLTLSDLENCTAYSVTNTKGVLTDHHPIDNDYNRCNPRLFVPMEFKRVGYPYWAHCGNRNYGVGVFDPPGAVPTADTLFPSTIPVAFTSTYDSATVAASPAPDQASSTSPLPQTTSPAISESIPVDTSTSSADAVTTSNTDSAVFLESSTASPTLTPTPISTTPTAIAVVGTNTLSAIPNSSGIILPNQSTATIGQIATLTDASGSKAVISVATSGVFVAGTDSSTTFFANPTVITTPTTPTPISTAIATVAGHAISAAAGDSSVVIDGKTVTSGGGVVTLSGTNDVASLGSDGLVVQFSGGGVSTFTLPSTSATAAPASITTVTAAGYTLTASAGASNVVLGTQTVALGGEPVTMANNDVVSLGSSGVVIQMPGGQVTTVWLPKVSETESADGVLTTSAGRVGSAIASSATTSTSTTNLGGNVKAAGTSTLSSGEAATSPTGTVLSSYGSRKEVSGLLCVLGFVLGAVFI